MTEIQYNKEDTQLRGTEKLEIGGEKKGNLGRKYYEI